MEQLFSPKTNSFVMGFKINILKLTKRLISPIYHSDIAFFILFVLKQQKVNNKASVQIITYKQMEQMFCSKFWSESLEMD